MKICVAQTSPVKGDIQSNIGHHKKLIALAISHGAALIVFPELSLTGYEPKLAKALATQQDDRRFDDFQKISNTGQITIGVGVPTKNDTGVCISMLIFQPKKARQTYSKKYIHSDEEAFFVSGQNFPVLELHTLPIALGICYEISVPAHAEEAFNNGATLYIASVAKFVNGIDKALKRLSEIAKKHAMTVCMSNCVGTSDGEECAGKTSIWNSQGELIAQLNNFQEGILIYDTDTQALIKTTI